MRKVFFFLFLFSTYTTTAQQGVVTVEKNDLLDELVLLKDELEVETSIYKIQIFFGERRQQAEEVMEEFSMNFPEALHEMVYERPNYKIWVGKYRSEIEADRALEEIRLYYKNAFIFNPSE